MRVSCDALRISVIRSKDAFEIGRHRIGVRHSQFMEPFPERANRGLVLLARSAKNIVTSSGAINSGNGAIKRFRAQLALDQKCRTAAPIRLDFADPGGAKTGSLLPTGNATDMLDVPGLGQIRVSLIDAANPGVFIAAADIGMVGNEAPVAIERDQALTSRLEQLRQAAAVRMGLVPDLKTAASVVSIPKVGILSAPMDTTLLSGDTLAADAVDIVARMISVGQPHRAVPLTGALCLAVACRVPGSVAHDLVRQGDPTRPVRIGHPSGSILVAAEVIQDGNGFRVPFATSGLPAGCSKERCCTFRPKRCCINEQKRFRS
jgi:2-methylaconitate cis-trans-isomerase PrpF